MTNQLHRCTDQDCTYLGQVSAHSCDCHLTNEQFLMETLNQIKSVIPMDFLRANSPPGATGITAETDIVGAIRLLVKRGRELEQRLRAKGEAE